MLIFNQAFVGAHYFRTNANNYLIGARTGVHQDLLNLKLDIFFKSVGKIANLLSLPGRSLSIVKCFSIIFAPNDTAIVDANVPIL